MRVRLHAKPDIYVPFPHNSLKTDQILMRPRHSIAKEYSLCDEFGIPFTLKYPQRLQDLVEHRLESCEKQSRVQYLWPKWTFGGWRLHVSFLGLHLGGPHVSYLGQAGPLPLKSYLSKSCLLLRLNCTAYNRVVPVWLWFWSACWRGTFLFRLIIIMERAGE